MATETTDDARYALSLLLRFITVSLETNRIVASLPALDISDEAQADAATTIADVIDNRPDAKVLPFRRVTPKPAQRYKTCVPLVTLTAAAGAWSDEQTNIDEPTGPDVEWVACDGAPRFTKGMFVARVDGRSMEPLIPDGAYCLFRQADEPSGADRPVLVRHSGTTDPATGGRFTFKRYRAERSADGVTRVVLEPANPAFTPIVLTADDANEVRVVAEVVAVVS